MKRKFTVLLLASALVGLAACQPATETKIVDGKKVQQTPNGPTPAPTVDSAGGQAQGGSQTAEFQVTQEVSISDRNLKVVFKTNRNDFKITKVEYIDLNIPDAKLEQYPFDRGDEVVFTQLSSEMDLRPWKYTFRITTDNKNYEAQTFNVYQAKDLEVSSFQKISDYTTATNVLKLRTLTIKSAGVLTIDNKAMTVEIEKLVSEKGGVIQNMSEESAKTAAKAETKGDDGGRIDLHADNAEGFLTFISRGQMGGKGHKGQNVAEGVRGTPGAQGEPGQPNFFPDKPENVCPKRSTSGGNGGQGVQGGMGLEGARGGDSGSFQVSIGSGALQFRSEVYPGAPGIGGDGGEGGRGGEPGQLHPSFLCRDPNAKPGSEGPRGDIGPQGPKGSEGKSEDSCFRIGDSKTCQSQSFDGVLK